MRDFEYTFVGWQVPPLRAVLYKKSVSRRAVAHYRVRVEWRLVTRLRWSRRVSARPCRRNAGPECLEKQAI
jgi:hypothetical protein